LSGIDQFILNPYLIENFRSEKMQSDKNNEKESNPKEVDSAPVEAAGLSNVSIGKSYLGDLGRSLVVFGFYRFIVYVGAEFVFAHYSASFGTVSGAGGLIAFVAALGKIVSIPAALIYFVILLFARALDKAYLRKAAIVWFFIFPALVLFVIVLS